MTIWCDTHVKCGFRSMYIPHTHTHAQAQAYEKETNPVEHNKHFDDDKTYILKLNALIHTYTIETQKSVDNAAHRIYCVLLDQIDENKLDTCMPIFFPYLVNFILLVLYFDFSISTSTIELSSWKYWIHTPLVFSGCSRFLWCYFVIDKEFMRFNSNSFIFLIKLKFESKFKLLTSNFGMKLFSGSPLVSQKSFTAHLIKRVREAAVTSITSKSTKKIERLSINVTMPDIIWDFDSALHWKSKTRFSSILKTIIRYWCIMQIWCIPRLWPKCTFSHLFRKARLSSTVSHDFMHLNANGTAINLEVNAQLPRMINTNFFFSLPNKIEKMETIEIEASLDSTAENIQCSNQRYYSEEWLSKS